MEDDIIMGDPHIHKGNKHAQQQGCVVNEPSPHGASEKTYSVHLVEEANSRASCARLDVLPPPSIATSHDANGGLHKPSAPKAKPTHIDALLPSKHCKATIASMVAQGEDKQTLLHNVVEATNRGFMKEDKCLRLRGTQSNDATQPLNLSARLLDHSGSSNARKRVLPKAACILRGQKGQEDKGVQRVPSNLSQASLSSKGYSLSEDVGASYQLKAENDVHMAIHDGTSRQQIR